MTWLLIAIILVLLASFLTLFAYFAAFYSSPRRVENPYKLPSGEQYEQGRELMLSLIRELDGIPFEPVTTPPSTVYSSAAATTTCGTAPPYR